MRSPLDGIRGIASPFGVRTGGLPYLSDDSLYLWDFTRGITTDDTGTPSIAAVAERSGKAADLANPVKATQPLVNANGGKFDGATLTIEASAIPALNAATGAYLAAVMKWDTVVQFIPFLKLRSATEWHKGRLQLATTNNASRHYLVKADEADGHHDTLRLLSTSSANTSWVLLEVQIDVANDLGTLWLNQTPIATTLSANFTGTAYPASNSVGLWVNPLFNGVQRAISAYDGVPPAEIRTSVSDYLMSIKP